MTLSARQQAIVQGLLEARRLGQPWQPEAHDESLDLDDAYAVQAGVAQALGWFPDGPRAWKVGGTSLVTAAPLPEVLSSPVNWPAAAQPEWLIEAELASGSLVVASAHPVLSRRSYYLVQPDLPERPALTLFKSWLQAKAAQAAREAQAASAAGSAESP